jgi:hypothetical protein
MINAPVISLKLDSTTGDYRPGQRLSGHFLIDGAVPWPVRSAELSILWYTAGQGEEDFAIHHFERIVDEPDRPLDLRLPRPFTALLPPSPLSYDGRIVKVCWCVRLRIYPQQGPDTLDEVAFRLGDVPAAKPE